ncbi:MAG TPA: hypothetical protein VLK33_18440 [Terriglobales bacterium]|nr:hypothetical protein [Terriglobales bacterium]
MGRFEITDGRARFVDASVKILGVAAVIVGAIWTAYTYTDAKDKDRAKAELDSHSALI